MNQPSLFDDAPAKADDKLFFGVYVEPAATMQIGGLRSLLCAKHGLTGKHIPPERLHATLHHLGDYAGLPRDIVNKGKAAGDAVRAPAFDVSFTRAGSFRGRPGNSPFVLLGGDGVAKLVAFQRQVGVAMMGAGLASKVEKNFTPHITLLYDKALVTEHDIEPVSWTVRELVLVHSEQGHGRHNALARWPLAGS